MINDESTMNERQKKLILDLIDLWKPKDGKELVDLWLQEMKGKLPIAIFKNRLSELRRDRKFEVCEGGYLVTTEGTKPEAIKSSIDKETLELLQNPELFQLIVNELDKDVVKEEQSRKVLLLCTNGKNVENADNTSYNLLVNDESGAGKDHLCKSVGKLYENEKIFIKRTRITPKVLDYWHTKKDEDWTWNGKILYLEDISYDVLNSPTMTTFLSSGSHTTLLKDQVAIDKEVNGKPVVLFTTAIVDPKFEILRRINILNLDTSVNQTKEIAKRKCRLAKDGVVEEINPKFIIALSNLKRVKVRIPFADLMEKWIDTIPDETVAVMLRTQIQTFLDYIKSITTLYQYQREQDEEGYFKSTEQDYEIARRCFGKMVSNPLMIPLTKNYQKIIEKIEELTTSAVWISFSDLEKSISFLSPEGLRKNLNKLVNYGILLRDNIKIEKVDKPVSVYCIKEMKAVELPSFDKLHELSIERKE